jgi:FixJ family two-component response regulator
MSPTTRGHVYVVDDNPDIRLYLTYLLRQKGYSIQAFESAQAFLQQPFDMFPAVLVLDVCMPLMSGIELQQKLASLGHHTPIVFISGESQPEQIIQAMKAQPVEFLWKPIQIQDLIDAVDRGLALDAQNRQTRMRSSDVRRKCQTLSAREREVLALMLDGHTNIGIAERLAILPDTAKKHRAHVLQKMQVTQLADLIALFKGLDLSTMQG